MESIVTETTEATIIADALAVIDKGLAEMLHRELVSTDEVANLLLDMRMLLTVPLVADASELVEEAPVGA
jgi:hypothetical protein